MEVNKKIAFLNEILSSSSSSSSSEGEEVSSDEELIGIFIFNDKEKVQKIKNYMNVVEMYSDIEFKKHFRVTRETYRTLKAGFMTSDIYQSTLGHGGSVPISPEASILSFLWFAGNKCCIRDVADRFGFAVSTAHTIFTRVMNYLYMIAPQVIKFPEAEDEKAKVSQEFFEICGFPGVIGCLDGTYISIRTPAHKIKSTYVNRHDMPSITLQAICNAKKIFLDVFTGTPSKIHDSRIYSLSFISKKLPDICGETYHLLGDSAYPIRKYLITPFRDYGTLSEQQQIFNKKFSATRVKIENSFGLLKQRWRQLLNLEFFNVDRTTHFIISCCVLHNLCIMEGDEWEVADVPALNDEILQLNIVDNEQNAKSLGEQKRDMLCNIINVGNNND